MSYPDVISVVTPVTRVVEVLTEPRPVIEVVMATGPQGPEGKWVQMTQAQYNALNPKDPNTLYVIVG